VSKISGLQSVQQGWNQGTAAMQTTMARGLGVARRVATRVARRSSDGWRVKRATRPSGSTVRRAAAKSARKSARGVPARLVKGSAAARRHMAKLRAMVGRRRR